MAKSVEVSDRGMNITILAQRNAGDTRDAGVGLDQLCVQPQNARRPQSVLSGESDMISKGIGYWGLGLGRAGVIVMRARPSKAIIVGLMLV
jgi:hypothetical protein